MADIADGTSLEVKGSGSKPYILKNVGGVYSCSCPAWRNQSTPIERRTCKHLKKVRGEAVEEARCGGSASVSPSAPKAEEEETSKAPPILLADSWDNEQDLTGWWMSEKLDGVRAYWDGEKFLSRQGNVYRAPKSLTDLLPKDYVLDGELWMGRKMFQRTVSVVRRMDADELAWKDIQFVIFDVPDVSLGYTIPFERRDVTAIRIAGDAMDLRVRAMTHAQCKGVDHLREELARIEALGGEGLMLRQPGSMYVAGRSPTLLKVKSFHDAEARVTGYSPGKGKHKGVVGALEVVLADGTAFSVGTGLSDQDRRSPPAVGSTITFRYQELSTGGVPRFPSFVRVRGDR